MKLFSLFFLAVVSANKESYIYNGKEAKIEDFPYQVGLNILGSLCGGNIISNTFIVTAAHCLEKATPKNTFVLLGAEKLLEAIFRRPRRIISHSEYDRKFLSNDIGLVEIDHIDFSDKIQIIDLPSAEDVDKSFESEDAYIAGWGLTESNGTTSSVLLYAEVQIMNHEECVQQYKPGYVKETNICAVGEGGSSTCRGDSGGPLVLRSRNILIGLTSFGPRGDCTRGSAFTFIPKFRDWIMENSGM